MKTLLISIILITLRLAVPDIANRIVTDETLIAPGVGAERLLIGENIREAVLRYGTPEQKSELKERRELFKDVFRVAAPIKIYFTVVHHYRTRGIAVFSDQSLVVAVAGMSSARITPEGVSLARGADYFVFSYGNTGMTVLAREPGNSVYLYPARGIGIIDDKNDDAIDMYIVFKPME